MSVGKVIVIVGGFLGDEGKGKATQYFCQTHPRNLCCRSSGGTNTGATFYIGQKSYKIHMLPVGAFINSGNAYLGNATYINLEILLRELNLRKELIGSDKKNVWISKEAHVVLPYYIEMDKAKEDKQKLGSTKNGVSIAAAQKYSYRGIRIQDFINNKERIYSIYNDLYPPTARLSEQTSDLEADKVIKLFEEVAQMVEFVDPIDFFEKFMSTHSDHTIIVEGTQGAGLDINHGMYPFVSAGSFTTFGLLDGLGYALAPDVVIMTIKAYGSYFGQQEFSSAFDDNDFRKYAGEFGTTTGRPRKLCWLNQIDISRYAKLIRPTHIFLNRLDTLNWFSTNGKKWKMFVDKEHSVDFSDLAYDGKITQQGQMFIDMIKEATGASVAYLGVGPKVEDTIVLL